MKTRKLENGLTEFSVPPGKITILDLVIMLLNDINVYDYKGKEIAGNLYLRE